MQAAGTRRDGRVADAIPKTRRAAASVPGRRSFNHGSSISSMQQQSFLFLAWIGSSGSAPVTVAFVIRHEAVGQDAHGRCGWPLPPPPRLPPS